MQRGNKWIWLLIAVVLTACVTVSDDPRTNEEKAEDFTRLGGQFFQLGQMERALDNLKNAVRYNPDSYPAHALLALVYERLGRARDAEDHYVSAIDLVERDSHEYGAIHNNYGAFLCAQNRVNDAEREFQLAIANRLYRTPEAAYENAGMCLLRQDKYEKAQNYFRYALKLNPNMQRALLAMAQIAYHEQRNLQARAYIERYHDAAPATAASLALGIKIESALGDDLAAKEYAAKLRKQFPDSDEALGASQR